MNGDEIQLLAFDIGAESGRAILGRLRNGKIAVEEIHRFDNGPVAVGDHLYTDILSIWKEMQTGLCKTGQICGNHLASVGVDTWGVDFALLDRHGHLIDNPRHYRDHRTRGVLKRALSLMPGLDLYSQTGNQFMEFNSLFQLLAIKQTVPDQLDRAERFLMLPDLLHYWLSGELLNELTNATTSQCFDQLRTKWAESIFESFDIPSKIFGQVVHPATICGTLLPHLAEDCGLTSTRVILPATHDTASAITAIPVQEPDYLYISSGTWSLVGVELSHPIMTAESYRYNLTNEGIPGSRTSFLQLVNGMWILQQSRKEWSRQGHQYSYDELIHLGSDAGEDGPFIDVSHESFLDPGDMPERIRYYCEKTGQIVPSSHGEIVRCILESLACKYRGLLEVYQTILMRKLKVIHIIGGGSRNNLLNQLTANYTGLPVIAGPVETTAVGNLLVQAMGLGVLQDLGEIRRVVKNSFQTVTFEPERQARWEERYQRYLVTIQKTHSDGTV